MRLIESQASLSLSPVHARTQTRTCEPGASLLTLHSSSHPTTQANPSKGYDYDNLHLIRTFHGTESERGFVVVHVQMVQNTGRQVCVSLSVSVCVRPYFPDWGINWCWPSANFC